MSKLAKADQFIDLSDYGRPPARWLANRLRETRWTPIHVTCSFVVSGAIAIVCILKGHFITAGLFLILKSTLDAADGELARIKNKPSYTGRYLDSLADIVLNFALLFAIQHVTNGSIHFTIAAFFAIQLQGTLYNYYHVILRSHSVGADRTSRVIEHGSPRALHGERQVVVDVLHKTHVVLYGVFDRLIHAMDREAVRVRQFPKWFMTMISVYGLGFQLLIIAALLALGKAPVIVHFFIGYSVLILVFGVVRRIAVKA